MKRRPCRKLSGEKAEATCLPEPCERHSLRGMEKIRTPYLQDRQNGGRPALHVVDAHEHVRVAAERAPVRLVHLAALGPVLDGKRELAQAAVDLGVREEQRRVGHRQHVVHADVARDPAGMVLELDDGDAGVGQRVHVQHAVWKNGLELG
jgi:hypothetical protein